MTRLSANRSKSRAWSCASSSPVIDISVRRRASRASYQVHVCEIGSDWERVHLLFRDYLRTHPEVAAEYGG